MFITHNLLSKQKTRKKSPESLIDLFPVATDLYNALDEIGIIERLKTISHLGVVKVSQKLEKTRYDYIMLQLYLHQFIKAKLKWKLKYSYNNYLSSDDFVNSKGLKSLLKKITVADAMQIMCIVCNIGHFHNTFTASRAALSLIEKSADFKDGLLNSSLDMRFSKVAEKIINEKDYMHFHLLNSWLVLEKCNQCDSVIIAKELLYCYLDKESIPENSKLHYVFEVFREVRNVAYVTYDLQMASTPFSLDIYNEKSLDVLFAELLSEYNDNTGSRVLIKSIRKLLDDTVYNDNVSTICHYRISKRMVNSFLKEISDKAVDYYDLCFADHNSCFNQRYSHSIDFSTKGILKLTFERKNREFAYILLGKLERMNNVRVGYYERSGGEITVVASVSKLCDECFKPAFKVLRTAVNILKMIPDITDTDERYLLCAKYFLYYFGNRNRIVIKPTIDSEICVICTRGSRKRIKILSFLISGYDENKDLKHEAEFLLSRIKEDSKNDISVLIPASIIFSADDSAFKTKHELDGMIIYPNRVENQIVMLESKNTSGKAELGKRCLFEKFEALSVDCNPEDIVRIGHDAYLELTI